MVMMMEKRVKVEYPVVIEECANAELRKRAIDLYDAGNTFEALRIVREWEHQVLVENATQKRNEQIGKWLEWMGVYCLITSHVQLLAEHMADYVLMDYRTIRGRPARSANVERFWLALTKLKQTNERGETEIVMDWAQPDLCLGDFNLLRLENCEGDAPISHLNLQSVVHIYNKFIWHVLHDTFFQNRTKEWHDQVIQLSFHLLRRCFVLTTQAHSFITLDDKEYVEVSDWDIAKRARVTYQFLMEVCLFSSEIWYYSFHYLQRSSSRPIRFTDSMAKFAKFLRDWGSRIHENELIKGRRMYVDDLKFTTTLRALLLMRAPRVMNPQPRELLVVLRLAPYREHCRTKLEVLDPFNHLIMVEEDEPMEIHEIWSMDALLCMYSFASDGENTIKLLRDSHTIVYDLFLQEWIYCGGDGLQLKSPSLMAIYVYLRDNHIIKPIGKHG